MTSPWAPVQSTSRNPYVDGLRGFSIFVVLFAHFSATCGPFTQPWVASFELVRAIGRNSCFGVTIFFVVSGYLITTSSIQRFGSLGRMRLREFYVYRASRILPLLGLLTVVNLGCMYAGMPGFALTPEVPVGRLLEYLFTFRFNILYLQGGAVLPPWAVLWSLAVEEVFYLGYPLLCRLLRLDWIIITALCGFAVLGPIARHRLGWSGIYSYEGCFDQLAFGCLAGIAAHRLAAQSWLRRASGSLIAIGATVVLGLYFAKDAHLDGYWISAPSGIGIGASVFLLGTALWTAPAWRLPGWLQGRTLRLLGFLSYELYLFHMPLYLFLKHLTAAVKGYTAGILPRDIAFLAVIPLLVALGLLICRTFGQPTQRRLRQALAGAKAARRLPGATEPNGEAKVIAAAGRD